MPNIARRVLNNEVASLKFDVRHSIFDTREGTPSGKGYAKAPHVRVSLPGTNHKSLTHCVFPGM
jgi:hypothetical protein